jgi:hypothetical protein
MKEAQLLDPVKARALFESGYISIWHISKAKPIAIMKALQKTLVVKRQFSQDLSEIFLQSGVEQQFATLGQAEAIITAAKKIMKSKNPHIREQFKKKYGKRPHKAN